MTLLIVESCEEGGHLVLRQDHHADLRPLLAQRHTELHARHVVVSQGEVEKGHVEIHFPRLGDGLHGRRGRRDDLEVPATAEDGRQDPAQRRIIFDVEHAQRLIGLRRHPSIPAHAIRVHQHP